ncbi:MAG: ABC transporter permease [Promethearchaeota archaeon]
MKVLTKKIFREFRFNKFRSTVIILTVTIAVAMLVGFIDAKYSFDRSLAAHQAKLNNADLRIRLDGYIPENDVITLLSNSTTENAGIKDLEGRIFEYASVKLDGETYDAYLIGVDLTRNAINTLQIRKGTKQLSENDQILVEQHFGEEILGAGADLHDELTINVENFNFTIDAAITGFVADSDYYYVVDERTGMPTMGKLCIIYMPLTIVQDKLNVTGINEILVKTNERSRSASQKADEALTQMLGEKILTRIYWDSSPDKEMYDADAGAMDKMGIVFGIFGLIAGAIAIYNSLSKLVLAQRTHIGLYGALGARKRDILYHYVGFGMLLGTIGTIFGWIGSILINILFTEGLAKVMYGLVTTRVGFDPVVWIGGTLITFGVVLVFSILSALPVLRLTPREAMTSPYSASQLGEEPLLERLLRPIGVFRALASKIPLRTVFMNKKRSLSTVLAVAASMVILVASVAMMVDIMIGINQNYSDYEKFDVSTVFHQPTNEQAATNWIRENVSGIDTETIEGFIFREVLVTRGMRFQPAPLQAFHNDSNLREFHVIEGKKELTKDKVLLGRSLAKSLGVNPGDKVSLWAFGDTRANVTVAGITGELFDYSVLWYIEPMQELDVDFLGIGISENVTGFLFNYADNLSRDDKEQTKWLIQQKYRPYLYAESDEAIETFERLMEMVMEMLLIIGLLGFISLAMFTFASMSLAMMDREMEFLALRAMGTKRRTILKVIFVENFLYGIFGLIVGVPITFLILRPTYDFIIPDWYIPVVVPLELWVAVIGLIVFCVFLSTSLIAWKSWRSSLPDMLHNRMIS